LQLLQLFENFKKGGTFFEFQQKKTLTRANVFLIQLLGKFFHVLKLH
jgi:hypothetical protein